MERSREDGSGGTKTGIHIPPPLHPNFFLLLNGLFSPVSPMNYVNDYGISFFPQPEEGRKREEEKTEVREMPPPHFFFLFLTLPLNNLSCWQCGPGFRLYGHVKG